MRFVPYDASASMPNVVVDGSPNEGTVLTLTHWPGIWAPPHLRADLSAQMAFLYLDAGADLHGDAGVVTNNHFDQDGLVGLFALVDPDAALARRDLMIDLAAAGDFGTYRFRDAARISMALSAAADGDSSPWRADLAGQDHAAQCGVLYERALAELVDMLDHPDRYRELWADEDAELGLSERLISTGVVTIDEHPDVDLAVVHVPARDHSLGGHRFTHERFTGLHPMAVDNATECLRILLFDGDQPTFTYRYETWVQLRSRRAVPRVDLAPLAAHLDEIEGDAVWHADAVGGLSPMLRPRTGRATLLAPGVVEQIVLDHLRTAPPAWNPYPPEPGADHEH